MTGESLRWRGGNPLVDSKDIRKFRGDTSRKPGDRSSPEGETYKREKAIRLSGNALRALVD